MLTLGQGLGQKMATVRTKLDYLTDKYLPPVINATNSGYGIYSNMNSLIHILHSMF